MARGLELEKNKAEQILVKMNEQLSSLNALLKDANGLYSKLDKKDKDYQKLNEALKSINLTTKKTITLFNSDKRKIISMLSEAEKFHNQKYLPIAEKINDPANGLSAKLKETNKDYILYKKIKADCEVKVREIAIIAKNCENKSKELAKIETAILKFHKTADSETLKISTLLQKATETNTAINQIHRDLLILNKSSEELNGNIKTLAKDSKTLSVNITEFHKTSRDRLADIQKVYEIAHETGLSGEFEKRRNNLGAEILKWERYVFWTSAALAVGVIGFFVCQLGLNQWKLDGAFDLSFYVRFLVFSPVVYYLYFVSTQYNKAKKLHDKYAFKTTLSMTIKSHIELLTQHDYFKNAEDCEKIRNFIIGGFQKIYSEPYISDEYKMKIKLANVEIDMQNKIIEKLSSIATEAGDNVIQTVTGATVK